MTGLERIALLARIADLETRLRRAQHRTHTHKRRADLWRLRWQHASGRRSM